MKSLGDAMEGRYDVFYLEKQHQVTFEECALGQVLSFEGALEPVIWQEELGYLNKRVSAIVLGGSSPSASLAKKEGKKERK